MASSPPETLAPFRKDINAEDFAINNECTIPELGGTFPIQNIFCDLLTVCIAQDGVNCPSPVIFDEDGSITSLFFGEDNRIVGFSGPVLLFRAAPTVVPRIAQAFSVLNGALFAGDLPG